MAARWLRLSWPVRASAVQRHVQAHQRRGSTFHWLLLDEELDEDFEFEFVDPLLPLREEEGSRDAVNHLMETDAGAVGGDVKFGDEDEDEEFSDASGLNQLRHRVVPEVCSKVDSLYHTLYHRRPKTKFIGSAFYTSQLPHVGASFEIGIIGRSNVGKSSLLNALQSQPDMANQSSTPGRTQCINLFQMGCLSSQTTLLSESESRLQGLQQILQTQLKRGQHALVAKTRKRLRKFKARRHQLHQAHGNDDEERFVIPGTDRAVPVLADLPGYGFAKPPLPVIRKWRVLMNDYLQGRVRVPTAPIDPTETKPGDPGRGKASNQAAPPVRQSNKLTVSRAKQTAYAGVYERLADFVRQREREEAAAAAASEKNVAASKPVTVAQAHERIIRRNNLRCLLVLLDARRGGLLRSDHEWLQLMDRNGVPAQIVLTKVDKVTPKQLRELVQALRRDLVVYGRICRPLIHAVSSHYKLGLEELRWTLCHIFVESAMAATSPDDGLDALDFEEDGQEDDGRFYSDSDSEEGGWSSKNPRIEFEK